MKTAEIILLVLGVIVFIVIINIAVKYPNPTPFQYYAFRLIASIGTACIGATIPGFFEISGEIGELVIRAGGACAFFALAYLVKPPELVRKMFKDNK